MEKRPSGRKTRPKNTKKKTGGTMHLFLGFAIVVLVMLTGIGCGFLTASMNTRPNLAEDLRPPATSHIYDINGKEIAAIHATENRDPVSIKQIPKDLQNAFIAVEDARFYEHMGIDPRGIARALFNNILGGGVSEGGSTITQQLAKNAYLTQVRTMKRKVQEMFLALQLERQYTKQEILELYLNQIYFGQGAYGIQAAAKTYFGKNVEELDLNECAMLAGIPKSPNYYSPLNNLTAAQERKSIVLDQMEKYHYISRATARELKGKELKLVHGTQHEKELGAYFIDYVTQQMIEKYGADAVYKDGLKIYTTLDLNMQRMAENSLRMLPNYGKNGEGIAQPQAAIVAIDPHTGHIKAMVGGRGTDQFNRATMAERQPGSCFKPFVFAAALESKFSANTIIEDSPIAIGDWEPQNYSRNFSGKVTLRTVAEHSLNVPTVRIAQRLGIDKPIYYAQEMGISTFVLDGPTNDRNLATSLGGLTRGVTPLEITSAYGTFANKGVHVEPIAIVKVLDRNGKLLEQSEPKRRTVIGESSAAELTSMLEGVVNRGTGTGANIGRPAAGKTGTTSDYRDAWFIGYTPDMVTGIWIGCDDNEDLDGMTGGNLPASMWRDFMVNALRDVPAHSFDTAAYRGDTIGEIKDDKKKEDKKKKDNKPSKDNKNDKKTNNKQQNTGAGKAAPEAEEKKSAPQQAAPQPAAPSTPPSVSGVGGKGKN